MAKQYSTDDILNSISWQLKRIADSLETLVDCPVTQNKPQPQPQHLEDSTSLREFLNNIGKDQ